MATTRKKNKMFTEINITPLTDIFLVLLIIMMVVAPTFSSADNTINVPEINSGLSIEQKNATVSITKEGKIYVNNTPVNDETLVAELTKLRPTLQKPEVVVKADAETKSSEILKVMNAAKEADYEKLVVAGEPLSKKDQRELAEEVAEADNEVSAPQREEMTFPTDSEEWSDN